MDVAIIHAMSQTVTQAHKDNLVASHLRAATEQLEKDARQGRYNTFCIRALGNAAHILGRFDFADRALSLLRTAPDPAFWAGAITNIEIPAKVAEGMRSLAPRERLEDIYPPSRTENVIQWIRSLSASEKHLASCLEGRFQEARTAADSGLRLEEVANTLAIPGEFDAAWEIVNEPALEPFRRRGVQLVFVIELFRRGRSDKATLILAELDREGLGAWERIHLALGISGRLPWDGYPFPDW